MDGGGSARLQRAVELHVGGQRYRVISSASPEDLERLARVVDDKIAALVPPGRPLTPQAILLAAMALANDLEEERRRSAMVAQGARSAVERLLGRVDDAIASVDASVGTVPRGADGARAAGQVDDADEPAGG